MDIGIQVVLSIYGMKLIDAIKQKGNPFRIPDCAREELPEFFVSLGFKTGAEIGVYQGGFTEKFCQAGLRMYGIDHWQSFRGQGTDQKSQVVQDHNYELAKSRLSPYSNCTLVRKTSMEALAEFAPWSLDFVYIDADHSFRHVAEDIYEWYGKIRSGGVICGHDYNLTQPTATHLICQVRPVVNAFIETFGIENFYTFGGANCDGNWLFFKP